MDNIATLRTDLRRLVISDYKNMRILETDPEVVRFTPYRIPQTEEQTMHRLHECVLQENKLSPFGAWIAELAKDKSFIGWFMLMPTDAESLELSFMVVRKNWSVGLATEIANALVNYAKEFPFIRKINAKTTTDNIRSIRALEKLGFWPIENKNKFVSFQAEKKVLNFFELKFNYLQ